MTEIGGSRRTRVGGSTAVTGAILLLLACLEGRAAAHDPSGATQATFGPRLSVVPASQMAFGLRTDLLLMTNGAEHRVTAFDISEAMPARLAAFGRHGHADGELEGPHGIALAPNGELFVLDTFNHRVQVFDATALAGAVAHDFHPPFLRKWGRKGAAPGELQLPASGLALAGEGPAALVFVGDTGNARIQPFTGDGQPTGLVMGDRKGPGVLDYTSDVAIDPRHGILYVTQPLVRSISAFDSATGRRLFRLAAAPGQDGSFLMPTGVAVDTESHIFVVDRLLGRILRFGLVVDSAGTVSGARYLSSWGETGRGEHQLLYPQAIAIDGRNRIYVASGGGRGQVFDREGRFLASFSDSTGQEQ